MEREEVSTGGKGDKEGDAEATVREGVENAVGGHGQGAQAEDVPPVARMERHLAELEARHYCSNQKGEQQGMGKASVTQPVRVGNVEMEGDDIEIWKDRKNGEGEGEAPVWHGTRGDLGHCGPHDGMREHRRHEVLDTWGLDGAAPPDGGGAQLRAARVRRAPVTWNGCSRPATREATGTDRRPHPTHPAVPAGQLQCLVRRPQRGLDLRLASEGDRVWRKEIGPDPMVVLDDALCTQVRTVAHRMPIH